MSVISELYDHIQLPRMAKVRQLFDQTELVPKQIAQEISKQMEQNKFRLCIKPGDRIAITAGSRGIANIALITKCLVDFVKTCQAKPFVVPAMGSHGGATADGQLEILRKFGITENYLGCPILSSMEVVQIGKTAEGHPVYQDKNAYKADGIILSCRIKPHNAFRGEYESGFMKMAAVGLGKHLGAEVCHCEDQAGLARLVPLVGKEVIKQSAILFGLGIIENANEQTCKLCAVGVDDILKKEPELLLEARERMARLWLEEADVLVIDEIGKNISGGGADCNIVGRYYTPEMSGGLKSQRIVILDLTDETNGNFSGTGLADVITRKLFDKIDFEETYPNTIISRCLEATKIPLVINGDQNAIKTAIYTCFSIDVENPRIIRIKNTRDLEYIYVSEALLTEVKNHPNMVQVGKPDFLAFDSKDDSIPLKYK